MEKIDRMMEMQVGMRQAISHFKEALKKVRTGRAHAGLLDSVRVDVSGASSPLAHVASIALLDARTIAISPWDDSMRQKIEKAIMNSDLGLCPSSNGKMITVRIPTMSEDRRREWVKVVWRDAEQAKVAIRNLRRSGMKRAMGELEEARSADSEKTRVEMSIQNQTGQCIDEIDRLARQKEKDIMAI